MHIIGMKTSLLIKRVPECLSWWVVILEIFLRPVAHNKVHMHIDIWWRHFDEKIVILLLFYAYHWNEDEICHQKSSWVLVLMSGHTGEIFRPYSSIIDIWRRLFEGKLLKLLILYAFHWNGDRSFHITDIIRLILQ